MALQKTTVSLNLGKGVDQSQNELTGNGQSFEAMTDFVWNKDERLDKRPGRNQLPTSVATSFPNPLTIGTSPIASGLFSHRNQLLLQNKGVLYTYLQNQSTWKQVGHHFPVRAKASFVQAGEDFLYGQDVGMVGSSLIYTYVKRFFTSGTFSVGASINVTVVDETSKAKIVVDKSLATGGANDIYGTVMATFPLAGTAYVLWENGFTSTISQVSVNPTTGATGSVVVLKSDARTQTTPQLPTKCLQTAYANLPGIGERHFFCYWNTSGKVSVAAMKPDGTLDTTMGSATSVSTLTDKYDAGFGLFYSTATAKLYLAWTHDTGSLGLSAPYYAYVLPFSITASAITAGSEISSYYAADNVNDLSLCHAMSFCDDPINAGQVLLFFDSVLRSFVGKNIYNFAALFYMRTDGTTLGSANLIGRGLLLSGKAIPDATDRNTVYLPATYGSDLEGTTFLLDVFRGKTESAPFVVAKLNPGNAFAYFQTGPVFPFLNACPNWVQPQAGLIVFPTLTKAFASFNEQIGTVAGVAGSTTNSLIYTTAVSRNEINLRPTRAATRAFLNDGTFLSGGYVGHFDGTTYQEHNFFIPPDQAEVYAANSATRATIATTAGSPGSSITTWTINFFGGASIPNGGVGGTKYIRFNTSVSTATIYYNIAGGGSPSPGVGDVIVYLTGTETAGEVATKTARAINIQIPTFLTATASLGSLFIVSTATGNFVSGNELANFTDSSPGQLSNGSYQYCVVWNWVDHNGQMYRSSPSVPVSTTVSAAYPVCLSFLVPPVTNRDCASVGIEIYRTTANGTSFYRLTQFPLVNRFDPNVQTISYLDITPDTQINANELLYTTGGVQPNVGLPAMNNVSIFKDRLVASSDESLVNYSKTALPSSSVDFTNYNTIALEGDGQAITGHAQLDDKLVVFKEKRILAYAGDGANDLGQGVSFSQPYSVASDVGCLSQKSVEITPNGLFFQSAMGISLLNRSLQVTYPGDAVKDYNAYAISSCQVLREDKVVRQLRFNLIGLAQTLVLDYLKGKWSVFSNYQVSDACLWQGAYAMVDPNGVVSVENKAIFTDQGNLTPTYQPSIETDWLKVKNVQDFSRVWRMIVLGVLKSPHTLSFKVYYDYDLSNFDAYTFASSAITGSLPDDAVYQPQIHLKRQKCQSMKVIMTISPAGTGTTEECLTLTDLTFLVGVKEGLNKVKASKKL